MKISDASKWKAGGSGIKPANPAPSRSVPHRRVTTRRLNKFLRHLSECGSINKAAELTDGNINTARNYKTRIARDPIFSRQAEDALAAYAEKVAGVLREEFFEGVLTPVVNKDGVVLDPKTGEPIWLRKRDAKLVLAMARKFDHALREVRTTVNVDGSPVADERDPEIRIRASELYGLTAEESAKFIELASKIYARRSETMAAITRPDYLDSEPLEITYTEVQPEDRPGEAPDEDEDEFKEPWE